MAANVRLVKNGPYVVTNVEHLKNWLGELIAAGPTVALCRCGTSAAKPFCDGSHARTDFSGDKDPSRVLDRRDSYDGVAVTVFDNRGICQHSGYCTDALPSAFRADKEPFVAPSGAPIGEIVRAVRACPSGALSFAIDGREARDIVDWHGERRAGILVTKDGPYRVTGGVPVLDETGRPIARNVGASLEHYAMCRCGHSQNKPFCSGMHWYIGFRDPLPDAERPPTLFEWCGGLPALTRMTRLFYERFVPEDPLLAPLFADMAPDHPERVAKWLGEVFGGPASYSEGHGGYAHMLSRHAGANLSEDQRARWVELLCRSGSESGLPSEPEFWSAFRSYLEWGSRVVLEYSEPDAEKPPVTSSPRWDWGPAGPPPRPSSQSDKDEAVNEPAVLPGEGEPVSFAAHIKVLFRERDQQSMSFAFDLWSYDDVRAHAEAIAGRLSAGTMPCDGAWPTEKTALFHRWVDEGMPA
jgi:CDGSH-type Zn-finger protein/truncated hemoglobin YjbI